MGTEEKTDENQSFEGQVRSLADKYAGSSFAEASEDKQSII